MDQTEKEVLLLCRKEIQSGATVFFDTGAQTSFVSKKLAQKLKLEVGESGVIRIASFSNKYPTSSPYYTTVIGVKTTDSQTIFLKVNVIEYLTNSLPIIPLDQRDVPSITNQIQLDRCEERPDILIEADYFSQFIPTMTPEQYDPEYLLESDWTI
ncbi:hypothetical protein DINM_001089 [Dirofilaria immitis]|nr:hypothetical protein [Dirofilaria immitis]